MRKNKSSMVIIGAALIAAAWLIKGEDIMQSLGLPAKVEILLLYLPAMLIFAVPAMMSIATLPTSNVDICSARYDE